MKKTLFITLLLLFTTLTSTISAQSIKELKIGIVGDENTLTPYTYVTGYPGLDLMNLLYDNLFQLDENNQAIPWLVKEFKASNDGLNYSFILHDGVKWQDGKSLTTSDVKFTFDYFIQHPKARFTTPLKQIQDMKIISDTEFSLTLKHPDPNFLVQPLTDVPILPKHVWENIANPDQATNALGSGPFVLEEYKAKQYYIMKANTDYFKGKPPINKLIFPIINDTTAMNTALQTGKIDATSSNVPPELVAQFQKNNKLKVERGPGYSTTLFQFNAERYPMSEKDFRVAIANAIDTKNLVDTVLLGYGEAGSPGFIHPSTSNANKDINQKQDLEKAKTLLEKAGFKDTNGDGFREDQKGKSLQLTTLVYANSPTRIRTAELISKSLKEIGLDVQVQVMDATTVDELVWPNFDVKSGRNYDMAIWGWSSTMQLFPDRLVQLFHSNPAIGTSNIGGYKNEKFDQLSDKLQQAIVETERKKILMEMQQFVAEEFPIITLYYGETINAYNPEAYNGFKFQSGKGIMNKLSFIKSEPTSTKIKTEKKQEIKSVQAKSTDSQKGTNTIFILLGIVALIISFIFVITKRNKK